MPDVVITPANIKLEDDPSKYRLEVILLGEDVTAGFWVYKKSSDRLFYKTSVTVTDKEASVFGFVVLGNTIGKAAIVVRSGKVNVGAVLSAGNYILSDSGNMCPNADLANGDFITNVGQAISTSVLDINILVTGEQAVI